MTAAAAARVLAVLTALCHLSWVAETISPSALPTRTAYVSELMALGQPWSTPFRLVDVAAGLLLLAAVAHSWRATAPLTCARRWAAVAAHAGFAVFALATVADAASPMACAPSVSAACRAAEAAGTLPLHHTLHTVSSSLAGAGALVGIVALAVALWPLRDPGGVRGPVRPVAVVAAAVAVAFTLVTVWGLAEIAAATPGSPLGGVRMLDAVGWSQRLQITLLSVGLVVAAVGVPAHTGARTAGSRE